MENPVHKSIILEYLSKKRIGKHWTSKNCTNKEVLILEKLLKNSGKAVSKKDLVEYVWWEDKTKHRNKLDVYIANIRKKTDKNIIKTIKNTGYKVEV